MYPKEYNVHMSLGDRFLKIAKSYLSSATDSLEDEWNNLSKKWEQGAVSYTHLRAHET